MTKLLFTCCLLLVLRGAAADGPTLRITLPDPGTYSYWVQAGDGTVLDPPVTVSEKATLRVASEVRPGDHVFVLCARNGQIVSQTVTMGLDGRLVPLKFSPAQFQPAPAPSPPAAAPPADAGRASGLSRLLTGFFSVLLALGVLWLLAHLVRTRGQPLLTLARRAGVDAPDPTPLEAEDVEATVIYTPSKRPLETVPEEAGLRASPSAARGPEMALSGLAALIGLQGLVAGSAFALTDSDIIIGRDGESGIVLAENTVSRRHARLHREGNGQFMLTDLGSANGVYVNGMRIQRAMLNSGDEIKIGDNYFRYQAEEPPSH